jgi:hypothetical protein
LDDARQRSSRLLPRDDGNSRRLDEGNSLRLRSPPAIRCRVVDEWEVTFARRR